MLLWWLSVAVLAVVAGAVGFWFYRDRIQRLLEVERVRQSIARDLHDDLGSSLSRISILSEVAKRKLAAGEDVAPLLDDIGGSARELVDALSDSIWAIDPKRDDLKSFATRLRRFAGELLEAQGMRCEIRLPEALATQKLPAERRRHLFLLLKEALNNAAKHAKAKLVVVDISLEGDFLRLDVQDDGQGFHPGTYWSKGSAEVGRGLRTMLQRAYALGGRLDFDTGIGSGTCVRVVVPFEGQVVEKRSSRSGNYDFQTTLRRPRKRFFFF
jgi:signal transduction histidine kinase